MAISYDDKYLFSGSADTRIIQWQVSDGSIRRKFEGHLLSVRCLALSSDNRILISGSHDCQVLVWDV